MAAALLAVPLLAIPASAADLYPGNGAAMSLESAETYLPSPELLAQCGVLRTVKLGGGAEYTSIQSAVDSLPATLSTNTCVVVLDSDNYVQTVTVDNIDTAGYRLRILKDPSLAGANPTVVPGAGYAAFYVQAASVTIQDINVSVAGISTYGVWVTSDAFRLARSTVSTGGYHAIYFNAASSASVSEVYSYSQQDDALHFVNSSNANEVSSVTLRSNGPQKSGVYMEYSSSIAVTGAFIHSGAGYGAHFKGGGYNTVSFSTIAGNNISYAAVNYDAEAGTMNGIEDCYVSNPNGTAVRLGSDGFVKRSTVTSGSTGGYAVNFAGSNGAVSDSLIYSTAGTAAYFTSGGNMISGSTVASSAGAGNAVYSMGAGNKVLNSYVYNTVGIAFYLAAGGSNTTIVDSTITANSTGAYALYSNGPGGALVTRSLLQNQAGPGVYFGNWGAGNSISYSTITSAGEVYLALHLFNSPNTTVADCYISGSSAVYARESDPSYFRHNVIVSTWTDGAGLTIDGTYGNYTVSSNTIAAGPGGRALNLGDFISGSVAITSNTIAYGSYGVVFPDGALTLSISSLTFSELAPGATAIHFLGGASSYSISSVTFGGANMAVNINASAKTGGTVTVTYPAGPKASQFLANDPAGRITWPWPGAQSLMGVYGSTVSVGIGTNGALGYEVMASTADNYHTRISTATRLQLSVLDLTGLAHNTTYYIAAGALWDQTTYYYPTDMTPVTLIEDPTSVYIDEVGSTTVLASAYAPGAAFSNMQYGDSAVAITTDTTYDRWESSGNYWTAKAPLGARDNHGAATLDGKIYVVGGYNGGAMGANEVYDPATNSWVTKTSLSVPRWTPAVAALKGKIYAIGGFNGGTFDATNEEYDPEANAWTYKTAMPTARADIGAVALGDKIYVPGGYNGSYLTTNEQYDPSANSWETRSPMSVGRLGLGVAAVGGKMYAVGGQVNASANTGATEEYDPVGNSWTTKAAMPTARYYLAAAAAGGKVYAIGGSTTATTTGLQAITEVYDPVADTWTARTPMPAARFAMPAASAGGRVYVIGGANGAGNVSTNEEYNPGVARQFTGLKPNMVYNIKAKARNLNGVESAESPPVSTFTLAAVGLREDGLVFSGVSQAAATVYWSSGSTAGGFNVYSTSYKVQASTAADFSGNNITSTTANLSWYADLQGNTTYHFRIKAYNAINVTDDVWTFLGSTVTHIEPPTSVYMDEVTTTSIVASAYAMRFTGLERGDSAVAITSGTYDAWGSSGNYWTTKSPMPTARYNLAAALIGGRLYAVGGSNAGELSANEEYDPAANAWTTKTAMPAARQSLAAASIGGKLYAVGGYAGGQLSTNEEYDPAANSWTTKAAMPTAREFLAAASIGGKLYAVGGSNGAYLSANEEYDPTVDAWTTKAAMPTARQWLAAASIWGKLYAVGGTNGAYLSANEEYDPAGDAWATKAAMPVARSQLGAASIGGKLYALGGLNGTGLSANEEYNPAVDAWTTKAAMPTARYSFGTASLGGKLYAVGGVGGTAANEEYNPGVSRVFTNLRPNTAYSFKAKARNQDGVETAESVTISTRTLAAVALPLGGQPFAAVYASSAAVTWSSGTTGAFNGPGASFLVVASTSPDYLGTNVSSYTYSVDSATLPLAANTSYYFRIQAYNAGGMTDYSWLVLGSTVTPIEAPTSVYFDEVGTTTVVASAYAPGAAFTGLERAGSGIALTTAAAYDIWNTAGNYWTTKTAMTTSRYNVDAAVAGGKIYVLGGTSNLNYEYDPVANSWATRAVMPSSRRAAVASAGGKIYVLGGTADGTTPLSTNEEYDPVENSWRQVSPVPTARKYLAAAGLNGRVYVLGGYEGSGNQNEVYDPVTNTWETKAVMGTGEYYHSAVVLGGKIYTVEGTKLQEYDPDANSWSTKANMPTSRTLLAAAAVGGKLYAIGGTPNLSTLYKMNEVYDPGTNTWTTGRADMANSRYGAACAAVRGKIYVIGGYNAGPKAYNEEYTPGVAQVFSGLTPNTIYNFKARAGNISGQETADSVITSTYTLATAALFEYGPTFSAIDNSTITVSWSSGTATGGYNSIGASYKLQVSTSPDFFGNTSSSSTYNLAVTTQGLITNTTYYFRVQAYNTANVTDHGWLSLGSTVTLANPPTPMPLVSVTTFSVTTQWGENGNTPGTLYWVEIATSASFYPIMDSSDTQNTSAVFSGLSANTSYFFQVAAYNRAGVPTDWVPLGSTVTRIETPTSVYVDDVTTTTILASAYAPSPAFTGLDGIGSGVALTTGAIFEVWGSTGNYWNVKASLTQTRNRVSGAAVGGKIYVFGGYYTVFMNDNEEYDPVSNTWTTKAPMFTARHSAAAGAVGGKIYVIGGTLTGAVSASVNEEYDPVANAWVTKKAMPMARGTAVAGVIGGKIYIAGSVVNTEAYDPQTDTWETKANIPTTRSMTGGAVLNGRFHVVGGSGAIGADTKHEAYDPVANTWDTKAVLPSGTYGLAMAALGGKLYAMSGTMGAMNYEYDPLMDNWTERAPLFEQYLYFAGVMLDGRIHALAGSGAASGKHIQYVPGFTRRFTGLQPNTQYTLKAKARGRDGTQTPESVTVSTYTLAALTPGHHGITYLETYSSSFTVIWSSGSTLGGWNGPGASYLVETSTSSDFTGSKISSYTYAVEAATLENLAPNTTYYTRVQAYNSGGMTDYSWLVLGSTSTLIEAPTSVYIDEVTTTSVVASAYAPSPAFSGMERGLSAVAITTGTYDLWGSSGNYWSTKASISTPRAGVAAGVIGGRLYAVGGDIGAPVVNVNEEYDPVGNVWVTRSPMQLARSYSAAAAVGGKLYVVGGYTGTGAFSTNEEYDPESNSWTTKAPMPTARRSLAAGVIGGKIYAVGGTNGSDLSVNEEYDPPTNTWSTKAGLPTARHNLSAGVVNGKLYAIGGWTGSVFDNNEEYDPGSNTWATKTPIPTPRGIVSVLVVGSKLYAVGGIAAGGDAVAHNEVYDPAQNTWATAMPMPSNRYGGAAGVVNGKLYVASGADPTYTAVNEEYVPGVSRAFSALQPNTLYTFKAKARNQAGLETADSVTVSTYTLAAVGLPVSGDAFAAVYTSSAAVIWSSGTAGAFNGPGASFLVVASTSPNYLGTNVSSYTYNVAGATLPLSANTTYYFRVQAYNTANVTDYSWLALGSTVTAVNPPLSMPVAATTTNTISVEWDANGNTGDTIYNAELSASPSFVPVTDSTQTTDTSYTFGGLGVNTSYYLRVNAVNRSGSPTDWVVLPSTYTAIEAPTYVYADEVTSITIVAAAYTTNPGFTAMDRGISGIALTTGTTFDTWGGTGNKWATKVNMTTARSDAAIGVIGGKIYVVGGSPSGTSANQAYDPVINAWAAKTAIPTARYGSAGAVLDGKLHVTGGYYMTVTDYVNYHDVYDPETNAWTSAAAMPYINGWHVAGTISGKMYLSGGGAAGMGTKTLMYDPDTDAWTTKANMNVSRRDHGGAVVNGKLMVFGNGSSTNSTEIFDPVANNWTVKAVLPVGYGYQAGASVGGKVYSMGGWKSPTYYDANYVYDPDANTWTSAAALPQARYSGKAAVVNGKIYYIGGFNSTYQANTWEYDTGLSRKISGLQPNSQHTFKAKARNLEGQLTDESASVSTYTLAAVGMPTSGVPFVNVLSDLVNVAWSSGTASGGFNGPGASFLVHASTASDFSGTPVSSLTYNNVGVMMTGLAANTTYYFRVQAYNAGGMTDYNWLVLGSTVTRIETPTSVYVDDVGTTTIVASAYAPTPAFSGMERGYSAVAITTGTYDIWGSTGNYWRTRAPMPAVRTNLAAGVIGGKLYAVGGSINRNDEYDPAANAWTTRTAMPTDRGSPAAAVIGSKLYVVGGYYSTYRSENEAYDPVANAWATMAAMPTARQAFAAAAIGGKLYAIGGFDGSVLQTNEEYDPALNAWATKAVMPAARYALAAAAIEGKLYAVGGNNGAGIAVNQSYDPVANTWTTKTSMPTPRSNLAAGVIGGKLFAVGGAATVSKNEEYDPATDAWVTRADMPTGRNSHAIGIVAGKLYAVGGYSASNLDINEEYTPGVARVFSGLQPNTLYTFKAKARNQEGTETGESVTVSTYTLAAVGLPESGQPFSGISNPYVTVSWSSGSVLTGFNGPGASYTLQASTAPDFTGTIVSSTVYNSWLATLELYPNTTHHFRVQAYNSGGMTDYSWLVLGSTATAIETPTSVYIDEVGTATIVASAYAPSPAFTGMERLGSGVSIAKDGAYDLWGSSGNYWTTKAVMPTARYYLAAVAIGGKLYAVGGNSGSILGTNEEYDPAANSWTTKAVMPTARFSLSAVAIGGRLYAVGGYDTSYLNANEEYDPSSNSWATKTAMPTARERLAAGAVAGKLYAVGGSNGGALNANEEYDPASDSWATKAVMPTARYRMSAGVISGKLYAVGGNNGSYRDANEAYDPVANSWTTKAAMPTARDSLAAAVMGGKLYAVGGSNGSSLSTNEEYDPAADSWTTKAVMPTARINLGAAVIGGRLYALGGQAGLQNENEAYFPGTARAFNGLTPNTLYSFKAKARNQAGLETADSVTVSTYTLAAMGLPVSGEPLLAVYTSSAIVAWSTGTTGAFNGPGASFLVVASTSPDYLGTNVSSYTYNSGGAMLDLASNTSYYFRMQAYNSGNMTDHSWLALGSTVTLAATPTALPAAAISTYSITADWDANGNAGDTWYTAQASGGANFDGILASSITLNTSAELAGLTQANTWYFLRVNALNRAGSPTPWRALDSTATAIETPETIVFTAVSSKAVTAQALTPGGFSDLTEEMSGMSHALDGSYAGWTQLDFAPFTGLAPNTSHTFKAKARNRLGVETAESATYSTYTLAAVAMPQSGEPFAGVYLSSASVAWSSGTAVWGYNGPGASYLVQASTAADYSGTMVSSFTAELGAALDLQRNTSYYFRTKAYNVAGVADNDWLVLGSTATEIETPSDIEFTAVTNTTIDVLVHGQPGFSNLGDGLSSIAKARGGVYDPWFNSAADSFGGLTPNTLYNFSVKARNLEGRETPVVTRSTYTLAAIPDTDGSDFSGVTASSFTASWIANGNPAGTTYYAQISTAENFSVVAASSLTFNTYAAFTTGVLANTTWYARVAAINGAGIYSNYFNIGNVVTRIETPVSVYVDEVGTTTIVASAYAPGAAFTGMERGLSAVAVTSGTYDLWGSSGNYWKALAGIQVNTGSPAAAVLGGRMYLVGGWAGGTPFSYNREYDPVINTWTTKAALPTVRYGLSAAAIGGKVYAVGGRSGGTYYAANEEYDPVGNAWTTKAPMITARYAFVAGAVGGKLYAVGGSNGVPLSANEEYDPATDSWASRTAMPTARSDMAGGVVAGRLYAVAGYDGGTLSVNEEYDPVGNTWTTKAALPAECYLLGGAPSGGKLYVFGGYYGGYIVDNRAYDPTADTWTVGSPLPAGRHSFGAASLNGKIYMVGGNNGGYINTTSVYEPGVARLFAGLTPNTQYSFKAKARNQDGIETSESVTVSTYTLAAVALDEGGVTFAGVFPSSAIVAYSPGTAAGGYNGPGASYLVQASTAPGFTGAVLSSFTASGTQAAVEALGSNTTYHFRIQAYNSGGMTDYSWLQLGTTVTHAIVPNAAAAPFGNVNHEGAEIYWGKNGNSDGTAYRLHVSSFSDFSDIYSTMYPLTSSTMAIGGLTPNTTWFARVSAVSYSGIDTEYYLIGSTLTHSPAPTDMLFTAVSSRTIFTETYSSYGFPNLLDGLSGIAVSWNGGYLAWQKTKYSSFSSLIPNTQHTFKAKARNQAGLETAESVEFSTYTLATASLPQEGPLFSGVWLTSMAVNWSSGTAADGFNGPGASYYAEVSTSPDNTPYIGLTYTGSLSHTFALLDPNTTHYYRVRGINTLGVHGAWQVLGGTSTLANAVAGTSIIEVYPTSATINWNALPLTPSSSTCEGYVLQASTASDFTGVIKSSATGDHARNSLIVQNLFAVTTYYLRVGSLNHDGTPNYTLAGSTCTPTENIAPTINDNELSTDYNWYSALPPRTYNIDFHDTGGSALEKFQVRATSGPNQTGILNADWTDILTGIDADDYTANWPLTAGVWDLMADGTNYISVRVYDGSGNKDELSDVFVVFKDTTPPAISETYDDAVWRSTYGFTMQLAFSDAHSKLDTAQGTIRSAPALGGDQLQGWENIITGADAVSYSVDLPMGEAGWQLLRDGTNYFSLRAWDYSVPVNTATVVDAFMVLKDTTPPTAVAGLYAVGLTTYSASVTFGAPYETPSRLDTFAVHYASYTVAWTTAAVAGSTHIYVSTGGAAMGEDQFIPVPDLADNTTYYYAVWSRDLAGNWSGISPVAGVATLAQAPAYQGSPFFYYSSATANWLSIPAAGFRVEVTTDSDHNGPPIATTAYTGVLTSLGVAGLAPNTTYHMRLASLNWAGTRNYGGSYEDSTFAVAPGSAAPFAVVSSVSVTVEWLSNGNGPGTRYALEVSSDNFVSVLDSTVTHQAGAEPYSYTFDGLGPNTTYWFNVLSIGNRGDADQWIALGSTVTAPVPPALTNYALWITSAVVAWGANGNGAGTLYQADLSTASNFTGTLLSSSTGSAFTFVMGAITPNTTYYLRLRAVSAATGMASPYVNDVALALAAAPGSISHWTMGANSAGLFWGNPQNPGLSEISAWSAGAALPAAVYGHAAAVAGDIAFVTGGYNGSAYKSDVWYAPITAQGAIGAWTQTRSMPAARYGHSAAALQGRLYIVGGYDGSAARAEVWSAPISSYGALGDWVAEDPLPLAVYAHSFAVGGNALYVAGGYNSGARDNVWYTSVNTDGTLTGWAAGPALPEAVYSAAAAMGGAAGGHRLYVTGGYDGVLPKTSVWKSAVNSDNSLAGWSADAALPSGLYAHAVSGPNDALVISGGNGGTLARTATLLGRLNADGTIAGWTAGPALPAARQSHIMSDRGGRLMTLGGYDGASAKSDGAQAMMTATEYKVLVTGAPFPETPWLAAGYLDIGGLAPNSYYSFAPAARNYAGVEAPGMVSLSTYTLAAQPSTAPISGVFISSVQVNWLAADNPGDTVFQAQLSSDAAHTQLAFSSNTIAPYAVFEGLGDNYTYYARVRAVNKVNVATAWTVLGSTTTRANPALDFSSPTVTNNITGEPAWLNHGNTLYDIDFADTGGAWLSAFEVRAATYPASPDASWTGVLAGMNTEAYSADWALPAGMFDLLAPGTNYISVRAWDANNNSSTTVDAFYILKDTAAPVITDLQTGEDAWRMDDAGAVYNVDFADDVSGLDAIEYSASPSQGTGDAAALAWRPIVTISTGLKVYADNWAVDFAALPNDATNFISVRARDLAGNTVSVTGIDVFKILKYVAGPEIGITAPDTAYRSALANITGTADDARSHAAQGVEISIREDATGKYWDGAGFLASSRKWIAVSGTATWTYAHGITWLENYAYQVVARSSDTAGNYSLYYATADFTFDPIAPVIAPLAPADGAIVNGMASITGTAYDVSGLAGMALRFNRLADGKMWDFGAGTWTVSGSSAAVAPAANWTYTPPALLGASLENGASYYYTLYAVDNSSPVLTTDFYVYGSTFGFTDNTAPAAVSDLAASTGNAPGNIGLTWTAPGDDGASGMILAGQYRVQHSTMPLANFSTAAAQTVEDFTAVSAGTARSKELTGLTPGTEYFLYMWTRDDAGNWSALSNGATAQAAPFPDRISGHVMTVSSVGITGVLVEAFDNTGLLQGHSYTVSDGSGTYAITSLPAGSYRVQATWEAEDIISSVGTDGIALGASNADFTLSIAYELASIGGELAGYRISAKGYNAQGIRPAAASVELYQRGRLVATAPIDANGRFLISNLLPGKYTLRVPDPAGGSKELSLRVKPGEALQISPLGELLKADRVYVYPNPASRTATFHIETELSPVRKQLAIFDITGRLIAKLGNDSFKDCSAGGSGCATGSVGHEAVWEIPSKVASGVYIYSLHVKFEPTGEHKKAIRKFAIVK